MLPAHDACSLRGASTQAVEHYHGMPRAQGAGTEPWSRAPVRRGGSAGVTPYPSAKRLSDVTLEMAQAYSHHLRESGKSAKTAEFKPKCRRKVITYEGSYTELSPCTVNVGLR